jgi:hypothetical protein
LRPAQENSSQDPISKVTRAKWTLGLAQELECLLQVKSPEFKLKSHKKMNRSKSIIFPFKNNERLGSEVKIGFKITSKYGKWWKGPRGKGACLVIMRP